MNRLKKLAANGVKLNKRTFKQVVLENGGYIPLNSDGSYWFYVTQINTQNFNDMTEKLEQQLRDEGKYDSWIGFVSFPNRTSHTIEMLPIYGDPQKYVTKFFTYTAEEAIDQCLADRDMKLLKRANDYRENNQY